MSFSQLFADIVALKGGYFTAANATTGILQRDLLCDGSEANLLKCEEYPSGTRDCPADHSEDAGVKCNGMDVGSMRMVGNSSREYKIHITKYSSLGLAHYHPKHKYVIASHPHTDICGVLVVDSLYTCVHDS